jgi:DNA polymerase-3 subunit chi
MTRIDFYSLADGSAGDRFLLTCRLVERIHLGERLRI